MFDDLYTQDVLALSATLKNAHLEAPHASARKVSKLCGSWLEIDLKIKGTGPDARVSECALRIQACALGQASAAILQENIIGASLDELREAAQTLEAMLKSDEEPPIAAPKGRFARIELLRGVRAYPPRHTSTLLAFKAAVQAFEAALERV